MMSEPTVLVLDEPSMGLAPAVAKDVFGKLRELADDGAAVLLADENAKLAVSIADEVSVMRLGEIVRHGSAKELGSAEEIAQDYFGT
jgi:branched-chain amino acid transport system ATP-binding protein